MKFFLKKIVIFILSTIFLVSSLTPSLAARKQFNIGTGFIGSSMHALGTVMAKYMQNIGKYRQNIVKIAIIL